MTATVTRLGELTPGLRGNEERKDQVDPTPVVLWAGERPAAVLAYRTHADWAGAVATEELVPLDGKGGPFAVKNRILFPKKGEAGTVDAFHPRFFIPADLDGDGADELVIVRRLGRVEVVGAKGRLFEDAGPAATRHARYVPTEAQVARVGGRAVVHVLLRRESIGETSAEEVERSAPDAYAILRVDARGVKRVVLGDLGWKIADVAAVGAMSRSGAEVDELVVLARRDEGEEVFVSRHAPDGKLLAPPRRIYVPFSSAAEWKLTCVPRSGMTVATSAGHEQVYFIEPEKPVNWIHLVDLERLNRPQGDVQPLGVADAPESPKAVLRLGDSIYAVDAEGGFYSVQGGAFVRARKPAPFQRLAHPEGFALVGVYPSPARGDEFLVAHTREAGSRRLPEKETALAAEKFLDPAKLAEMRRDAKPSLEGESERRDDLIEKEKKRRGLKHDVTTVEQWRRELPDSYKEYAEYLRNDLDGALDTELTGPLRMPWTLTSGGYRNLPEFRAWLAGMKVPAETVLEVMRRGARVRELRVPGELGPLGFSDVVRPFVDWREGPSSATAVTSLVSSDGGAAFFEIRGAAGGR